MVFADEAPLVDTVTGSSTFQKTFPQRGPRDAQGRSLRDYDLKTRLFQYPLSYMIYSAAFDALPADAKRAVYGKLKRQPGVVLATQVGVVLPAATPRPVVRRLADELARVMKLPEVLAGMSPQPDQTTPTRGPSGNLYQAIAGTSMSSPHAAGVSALVKAVHPDWTPEMIKSMIQLNMRITSKNPLTTGFFGLGDTGKYPTLS